jgi:DNA ligase (NAD+)
MAKQKYNLTNLTADEQLYLNAKEAYYKGQPIMNDPDFDALEDRLRAIDSFVCDIVGAGSKAKKIPHLTPMGSLAKVQFKTGIVPWDEFKHKFLNQVPATATLNWEPKLDGNAINITYTNEVLTSICSRGDGIEGQDYTKQLKNHFPQRIKGFSGEIRGEAVIEQYLFNTKYKNEDLTQASTDPLKKYSNARNFVAGILSRDYSDKIPYNEIDVVCFEIVGFTGNTKQQLIKWGFQVHDFVQTTSGKIDENKFVEIYEAFTKYRTKCKYQLDGIVTKTSEDVRSYLGKTSHHPLWALAIKFITEEVTTTIERIEWNMGKQGDLRPVAILKPVELLGSIVRRASIYNADWIINKKAFPGAEVTLVKSGDIIPMVVEVVVPAPGVYNLPTEYNGNTVTRKGVHIYVDGFENTTEFKANKLHSSVVALGIENLGPATCERITEAGLTLKDLLSTNPDGLRMSLLQSGLFKDGRELEILINSVFAITKVNLWEVIYAMQYRNCGKTISKQIANWMTKIPYEFKGLEKEVVNAFLKDTKQVDEVTEMVGLLLNQNIKVIKPEPPKKGIITFEMTGDCTTHPSKGEFKHELEQTGKFLHASLGKDTSYLVTNTLASNTSKMQKATKYNVKIVTYEQMLDIAKSL